MGMEIQEIIDALKPYLKVEEYRQNHVHEVEKICEYAYDLTELDMTFKLMLENNLKVLKKDSKHHLGTDEWVKHVNGLIHSFESKREK